MPFLSTILDLVFPARCLGCGVRGESFCLRCLAGSPKAERECARWIYPIYEYRHPPIKKSVHLLKYKGKTPIAEVFGEAMYSRILEELADLSVMENFSSPLLIPIPLSRARLCERGYNQAELICRKICGLANFTLAADVLIKPKESVHQAKIENRAERIRNMAGSFAIAKPEKIKGRNIILIDDVVTTGATLSEAKKILRAHGARKVIAFALAH